MSEDRASPLRKCHAIHLIDGTVSLDFIEDEDAAASFMLLEDLVGGDATPSPDQAAGLSREDVAKLIDPVAFERIESGGYRTARYQSREDALTKADQIIAAFREAGR